MATIAQKWIEQGIERGVLQNARESVLDILQVRFATVPPDTTETITTIDDPVRLKEPRKQALTAASPAEFEQVLEA